MDQIIEDYSPYCPVCNCCGEDGCCPASCCQQSPDGRYCKSYLQDLKFSYLMYKDMWALIPGDAETQAKLDKIYDDNYDLIYKQNMDK